MLHAPWGKALVSVLVLSSESEKNQQIHQLLNISEGLGEYIENMGVNASYKAQAFLCPDHT